MVAEQRFTDKNNAVGVVHQFEFFEHYAQAFANF